MQNIGAILQEILQKITYSKTKLYKKKTLDEKLLNILKVLLGNKLKVELLKLLKIKLIQIN